MFYLELPFWLIANPRYYPLNAKVKNMAQLQGYPYLLPCHRDGGMWLQMSEMTGALIINSYTSPRPNMSRIERKPVQGF